MAVGASVLEQFLELDCSERIAKMLRDEIEQRGSGSRYFTFNTCNVNVDVDAGVATIEDELDPDRQVSLPLDEFAARLSVR